MALCAIVLVAVAALVWTLGVQPPEAQGHGIFFTLQGDLISNSFLSFATNVLCLLITGGILLAVNKIFTFVRSMTHLFVSAFFLFQLANPAGLVSFNAGTLLCIVTAVTLLPLFASYQDHHSQRSIFLIFALTATGCMFHYCFLVLIPTFILGFLYMGSLNVKGLLAMLFGLITPFWIVLGLGLAKFADFTSPHITGIWQQAESLGNPVFMLATATAVLGIVLAVMNLHTIMNYRMQTRVYNVFFVITLLLAIVALCLDYSHAVIYLPQISLMVAIQIALVHTLRNASYRYIFILLFTTACLVSCAVNLMLP